jgi:hypothetical protein
MRATWGVRLSHSPWNSGPSDFALHFRQFAEHGAEDVGAIREVACAEAVADLLGFERGHKAKVLREFRGDGGTSRGDQLVRFVDLPERDAAEDLECRGGGDGESAVRALHGTVSIVQAAAKDFLHAECFNPHAGQDDVGDAIEGADFVEMDCLGCLTVDFAFGHCDAVKDRDGPLFHEVGEFTAFDHRADFGVGATLLMVVMMTMLMLVPVVIVIMVMIRMRVIVFLMLMIVVVVAAVPMFSMLVFVMVLMLVAVFMRVLVGVRMPVFVAVTVFLFLIVVMPAAVAVVMFRVRGAAMDVELHALDILPLGAVVVHVKVSEVQLAQFPFQRAGFHAEVDQGTDHHVAADSGNAVEVESFHAGKSRGRSRREAQAVSARKPGIPDGRWWPKIPLLDL